MIILFTCLAGFFDGVMDMIKDFHQSDKNWLWQWVKGTKYQSWYDGWNPLPFFDTYRPGMIWLSDAWHMAKHCMLLCFAGALSLAITLFVSLLFEKKYSRKLEWYYQLLIQIVLWWTLYWLEGEFFNLTYQRLK
jgi:hypothetical protein